MSPYTDQILSHLLPNIQHVNHWKYTLFGLQNKSSFSKGFTSKVVGIKLSSCIWT